MTLHISNTPSTEVGAVSIYPAWLLDKGTHLFIASNVWDKLHVDICDEIPDKVLRYVVMKCKSVEVTLPDELSDKHVALLCELYPSVEGQIRKAAMLHRDVSDYLK